MKSIQSHLILLSFFIVSTINAQYTEVINSNRPGVSRSAFSVGTNVVQFEAGPYYIKEKHTPLQYEVSGVGIDFAARYGLLWEQLEVNIEGNFQTDKKTYFSSSITTEDKRGNFKYLAVGAKYLVYDPYKDDEDEKPNLYSWNANHRFNWKDLIPAIAVYAGANYDTKDNPYTAYGVEGFSARAMVATQNNFASGWVFVTNFMLDRIGSDQSDFSYILTLTKAINTQWVVFGEAQGISSDFYADNLFRFGGAYLWSKDFQLDTALTFNTKDTPSVFSVNLGISYRLDFHEDKEIDNGTSAEEEGKRKSRASKNKRAQEDFN